MPRADAYIAGLFSSGSNKTAVRSKVLTQLEAASLARGLRADAADFYYSAWISFIDALNGINKGFYTWATVKLYYSVFYSFRASLAMGDFCAFHVDRYSFTVSARKGASPQSCADGGTHKTVLKAFQRFNPSHELLSQKIDLLEATDWFIDIREAANYRRPRFTEPNCESTFAQVSQSGLRRLLSAYSADTTHSYAFDPDHAVVAYPFLSLQLIGRQIKTAGLSTLSEGEQEFMRSRLRDGSGLFSMVISELKDLAILT